MHHHYITYAYNIYVCIYDIKISLEHTAISSEEIMVSVPWRWRYNSAETCKNNVWVSVRLVHLMVFYVLFTTKEG
jgi:hypothetical protein